MRLPHIPKIDWEPLFKLLEKFVVIYKLIEGFNTMFDFFSSIKNRVAALEADVKAIYAHIKAELAAKEANFTGAAETVSAPPATLETPATTPTVEAGQTKAE